MWKSIIKTDPLEDEEGYTQWLDEVMSEPWVEALWDLVQADGVWVGTEEQLIQELKLRVGREVAESEDFPSSLELLIDYQGYAIDGFLSSGLGIFDYRQELADGDLDDFDVPGWGPEAPVFVKRGDACYRPDYWKVQFELLKYWHPFPVAISEFTASKDFPESRRWMGTTTELSKALSNHYPTYLNIPWLPLDRARPEGVDAIDPWPGFATDEESDAMLGMCGSEAHLVFYKMMKKWAPILKEEAKVKISWEKRTTSPMRYINIEHPPKTYWTIEGPRWYKRDMSHAWGSRPGLMNPKEAQE